MHKVSRLAICILMLCSLTTLNNKALAGQPTASPTGFPTISPIRRAQAADIVLEGAIIGTSSSTGTSYLDTATILVERYLKGSGPDRVKVRGFGSGADCRPGAYPGTRSIFFIEADENNWQLSFRLGLEPLQSADPASALQISEAVGQLPVTPVPTIDTSAPQTDPSFLACMGVCLIPIFLLGALGFIGVRGSIAQRAR